MIVIRDKTIINGCASIETYKRGLKYFREKKVCKLDYLAKEDCFFAEVEGANIYEVEIGLDNEGDVEYAECECLAYASYGGFCKHIVAVLLEIRKWYENKNLATHTQESMTKGDLKLVYPNDHKQDEEQKKTAAVVKSMLDYVYRRQGEPAEKFTLLVEPSLIVKWNNRIGGLVIAMSLRVGEDKLYMVKNLEQFLQAIEAKKPLYFGKKFTYDPKHHSFTPEDKSLIDVLVEVYQINRYINPDYGYNDWKEKLIRGKEAVLAPALVEKVVSCLKGRVFPAVVMDKFYPETTVLEEDLPLQFNLTKENNSLVLNVDLRGSIIPLNKEGRYLFYQGNIYYTSQEQQQKLFPFYFAIRQLGKKIVLPEEYQEQFITDLYPWLTKAGRVEVDESVAGALYQHPLQVQLYLDEEDEKLWAEVKYSYGEYSFNSLASDKERPALANQQILVRDREKEQQVMGCLEEADFKVQGRRLYLADQEKIFEFLYRRLPKLQEEAEVYYSDRLKKVQIRPAAFRGKVGINSETDLLEIGFELNGIDGNELVEVFNSLREKKKFYRLKDGSFLPLEESELVEMAELLEGLDVKKSELAKQIIKLPKYRAVQLDQAFQENKVQFFRKERAFKDLIQNIKEPQDMDFRIPVHLEGVLRDYQKFGYKWLKTLTAYGFGGILADDMGLGKTLQAIAFIYSERDKMQGPVLVVAPTSVVFNWEAEIARFTPDLAVRVISGTKEERQAKLNQLAGVDVLITSYALLRRDISDYLRQQFSYLLLDEAQYIKNPSSLTAKAAKQVPAKAVVALTGTPMENSLTELWSIFDCIMPGYLYSHQKFMTQLGKAVQQEADEKASMKLAQRVNPFILRRLKKDVLAELPDKIEHKLVSELTVEQKKVYLAYWERLRNEALAEIGRQGFDKSRIKILAGLTRLRQICCHPALFLENYRGKSGKLEQLRELIQEAVAGGHRILIFSQFTSMLKIIGEMLVKDNLEYFYLDGSVQAQRRLEMANSFNAGGKKLFLVSLKAGGTGLNLIGADMVIHFDLWWNPAVEDQASDRAHRIGQKRSVQVMKLVAMGTIEEKIYELQQQKKELVDRVIKPGESMLTTLSEDDIKKLLEI